MTSKKHHDANTSVILPCKIWLSLLFLHTYSSDNFIPDRKKILMFTREKLRIQFNLFFRNIIFHLVFWYISLLLYAFFTGDDKLFSKYLEIMKIKSFYLTNLLIAASVAVLFTIIDLLFRDRTRRFSSSRILTLFPSLLYFILGLLLLVLAPLSPESLLNFDMYRDTSTLLPKPDIHLLRFLLFFYLACFFNNFLQGMIKKVGKSNFGSWLLGGMNKPKEEERIFMFIDMKSSTTIAEQLSHQEFSHLVQDVFNDLAIVDNYQGEIYQYMGDGAIISWPLNKGLKNNNVLKAFYGFTNVISRRDDYYHRRYQLIPRFKAGIHVGKVMKLQVGRIRKDISYNGDTLNTAARIESMCNEYNKSLLISGDLHNLISEKGQYVFKEVGNIRLKGKRRKVDVFQVREKRIAVKETSPYLKLIIDKLNFHKKQIRVPELSKTQ